MKKSLFFITLFFSISNLRGEESIRPCPINFNDRIGLNALEGMDCKMAATVVNTNKELIGLYEERLSKSLSQKLAKNAAETMEDIALIDSFFDQNGIDLSSHQDVKVFCKIEEIAEPKCNEARVSKNEINARLNQLLKNEGILPKSLDPNIPNTLRGRLLNKAKLVRNANNSKENSCPIKGDSGNFILNSPFTQADAKAIIESGQINFKDSLKNINAFPHLKLITHSSDLMNKLDKLIKSYNPSLGDEKTYIDNFFKSADVQEKLGTALATKCKNIKNSIAQFVCRSEKPTPILKESDRFDLFGESDVDEDLLASEVGRGLSCKNEEDITNGDIKKDNPLLKPSPVSQVLSQIIPDLRSPGKADIIEKSNMQFCELYNCQTDISKSYNSCRSGGPINSYDLLKTCNGNESIACEKIIEKAHRDKCFNVNILKCPGKQQKYLSYIKMRERDAINLNVIPASLAGIESSGDVGSVNGKGDSVGSVSKPRGYSNFFQNFLGVEGTLIAEGIKPTPAAIAAKGEEFRARDPDLKVPGASLSERTRVTLGSDFNEAGTEVARAALGAQAFQASHADGEVESDANRREREALQSSLVNAYTRPDRTPSTITTDPKPKRSITRNGSVTDDKGDSDLKGMRDQLDDILGSIKSLPPSEQLQMIAGNNQSLIGRGGSLSGNEYRNKAEQERLDRYRDRLQNWDKDLNSWSNELRRRENTASWGSPTAANVPVGGSGINPKVSPTQSYPDGVSGNGVKLTTASGAGANGLKVDGAKGVLGVAKAGGIAGEEDSAIVASDKLSELHEDGLKKLGVKSKDSFIIRVRHLDKIYAIPVKSLVHEGKSMFVPLLSEETRNLAKIVMESPLFADYRDYQSKLRL